MVDLINFKTIIFHHIPKTAGTTLYGIFDSQFKGDVYTINGNQLEHEESLKEFINLSEKVKNNIKLLKGHRLYGIDSEMHNPVAYITVIRDPAKRFISSYYQMQKVKPELPERIEFIESKISLEQYIEKGDLYYGYNSLIKSFLNIQDPKMEITPEFYANAIQIAKDKFLLVGLTEKFDETIVLLNQISGIDIRYYLRKNVANNYDSKGIDEKLLNRYNELNSWDHKFYKEMEILFTNKIKEVNNFNEQLLKFRSGNQKMNNRIARVHQMKFPLRMVKKILKSIRLISN